MRLVSVFVALLATLGQGKRYCFISKSLRSSREVSDSSELNKISGRE